MLASTAGDRGKEMRHIALRIREHNPMKSIESDLWPSRNADADSRLCRVPAAELHKHATSAQLPQLRYNLA
jgi:hypothetical protein